MSTSVNPKFQKQNLNENIIVFCDENLKILGIDNVLKKELVTDIKKFTSVNLHSKKVKKIF